MVLLTILNSKLELIHIPEYSMQSSGVPARSSLFTIKWPVMGLDHRIPPLNGYYRPFIDVLINI